MRPKFLLCLAPLALLACSSDEAETTRGAYTAEQVHDLEIAAAARNPAALRELQIYYDMEGRNEDSENIHRQRLANNDPEAVRQDIWRRMIRADEATTCASQRAILEDARGRSLRIAELEGLPNPERDELYMLVAGRLAELQC